MQVFPALPVVTAACFPICRRAKVRPASGIPARFVSGAANLQNSGKSCRENVELWPLLVIARSVSDDVSAEAQRAKAEAIHASASDDMDCFACNDDERRSPPPCNDEAACTVRRMGSAHTKPIEFPATKRVGFASLYPLCPAATLPTPSVNLTSC
jgi:hypothetical protein